MNDYTYLFKFVLVGDSGVGKSCLMNQYIFGKFREEHEQTIGVEFESKLLELNDDITIQIQAWDTAGDKQFKAITRTFFKNTAAGIFVYDTTNRNSFESIEKWYDEFKLTASELEQFVIVGTKIDYQQQRQVSTLEGQRLAEKLQCKFYEVNCHCKDSIDAVFNSLSYEVLRLIKSQQLDVTDERYGVKSSIEQQAKKDLRNENQVKQEKKSSLMPIIYVIIPLVAAIVLYQVTA